MDFADTPAFAAIFDRASPFPDQISPHDEPCLFSEDPTDALASGMSLDRFSPVPDDFDEQFQCLGPFPPDPADCEAYGFTLPFIPPDQPCMSTEELLDDPGMEENVCDDLEMEDSAKAKREVPVLKCICDSTVQDISSSKIGHVQSLGHRSKTGLISDFRAVCPQCAEVVTLRQIRGHIRVCTPQMPKRRKRSQAHRLGLKELLELEIAYAEGRISWEDMPEGRRNHTWTGEKPLAKRAKRTRQQKQKQDIKSEPSPDAFPRAAAVDKVLGGPGAADSNYCFMAPGNPALLTHGREEYLHPSEAYDHGFARSHWGEELTPAEGPSRGF